ncbi:MAG: DNA polymerase III subunit beta [Alistipes sp.]|nr:DNA polymerase III subunit beta [Alistipes sp.]
MKFTLSSSALLSRLSGAGKVISNKSTLPILEHFLFELKDGVLKVTASDLEIWVVTEIAVDNIEREGRVAAPAKLLLEVLKECAEMPLTIDVNEQTWEIKMTWHSGGSSVPGANPVSYPSLQTLSEEAIEFPMEVDTLLNGVNKTIFAAADDDLKPAMNGVFFNIEPLQTTFVATDAHKLVEFKIGHDSGVEASFILPKKPAVLLKSMLLKEEEPVKVGFDKSNAIFKLSQTTLICHLIESKYPNYNVVIPTANPNKMLVDRVEFLNSLRRVAVCANSSTNLVRLDIDNNHLTLTAQDAGFYMSANETLSCSYEGDKITIGFNSAYLVEILSNIDTPTVLVELGDSSRAAVFKPVSDDDNGSATLMLLMPMLINL